MTTTTARTMLALTGLRVDVDRHGTAIPLVRDATLQVRAGEIVCLVGESGSGKSVTARTIMGLTQLNPRMSVGGSAVFDGDELFDLGAERMRRLRGRELAMVFQEPLSSLDPVWNIDSQLREGLRRRERVSQKAETARLLEALAEVGIHDGARVLRSYPHQLSGGMCQRVMIAMALLARPKLLIADEPTTALDVTIQAQILELIDKLRRDEDMSVLLVTHDMGVAADLADRVVVMYAGRVVEDASPRDAFARSAHPYTKGLLACIPPMIGTRPGQLPAIPGTVPDPSNLPSGCSYHPRCPRASERCTVEDPPLAMVAGTAVACWRPGEVVIGEDELVTVRGQAS
ncbi:ABC transporter ATP-binding protein [Occultella aeris]|uniref:Oligopeptide transport ATP-binding protein OppD n=1 Tax=Occultella aeris TaxID=2761496 RepID=A0A7M4DSK0_9MICO|nr:ABC transporter ATP-binding protein [Occultella aeris]VZO40444.1 Oligopeptide transport ATP-binding protein OppD [Occultella aeris]